MLAISDGYKPDSSPPVASTMYYFAWLFFCGTPVFAIVRTPRSPSAILQDTDPTRLPAVGGLFQPVDRDVVLPARVLLFDSGPFAWRGLFIWWIPLTFSASVLVNGRCCWRPSAVRSRRSTSRSDRS